jgi:hypothetical protein
VLDAEGEIPLLGLFLGALEVSLFSSCAMVAASEIGRALPIIRVFTLVDVKLSTGEVVAHGHTRKYKGISLKVHDCVSFV